MHPRAQSKRRAGLGGRSWSRRRFISPYWASPVTTCPTRDRKPRRRWPSGSRLYRHRRHALSPCRCRPPFPLPGRPLHPYRRQKPPSPVAKPAPAKAIAKPVPPVKAQPKPVPSAAVSKAPEKHPVKVASTPALRPAPAPTKPAPQPVARAAAKPAAKNGTAKPAVPAPIATPTKPTKASASPAVAQKATPAKAKVAPAPATPSSAKPTQTKPTAATAAPTVKPAPAPEAAIDLDSLSHLPARTTAKTARPAASRSTSTATAAPATTSSQSAALGALTGQLQRLWSPNCDIPGGRDVVVTIGFTIGRNGRVTQGPQWRDPQPGSAREAGAARALAAVHRGEVYSGLPAGILDKPLLITFDARQACAGH